MEAEYGFYGLSSADANGVGECWCGVRPHGRPLRNSTQCVVCSDDRLCGAKASTALYKTGIKPQPTTVRACFVCVRACASFTLRGATVVVVA